MDEEQKQKLKLIHDKANELYEGLIVHGFDADDLETEDLNELEVSRTKIMSRCVKLAIEMITASSKCSCIWGPESSQGGKS